MKKDFLINMLVVSMEIQNGVQIQDGRQTFIFLKTICNDTVK
jgi:hypothetical protein